MKLTDLKKFLRTRDQVTHIEAWLPTESKELHFIYNEAGLRFDAKHYRGMVSVFHAYDDELYSDAHSYLQAVSPTAEHRRAWALAIQNELHRQFFEARLKLGQPVRVASADLGEAYDGFIKRVEDEGDTIVVAYDGRTTTAKLKSLGKSGLRAYQGRGTVITLGGLMRYSEHGVVLL